MHSIRTTFAVLLLILAAALCALPSYAQTVTFTFNLTCDTNKDHCPPSQLYVASGPGGKAGDSVTIATVNSDVPGYTTPIPINGGNLGFTSSPATRVMCDPPPSGCYAMYDNPGGNAGIVGSVFGLPDGTTLLTASFQAEAGSYFNLVGDAWFGGPITISFINPAILDNLGLTGMPNCGTGDLEDRFYSPIDNDGIESFSVSVTFKPGSCYSYSVIHNFTGGSDGWGPQAGLTTDKAGNLYGTAIVGGRGGYGTVFKLAHINSGWILTPLYSFTGGNDGAQPRAKLAFGPDGSLYGTTTQGGGGNGCGGQGCGTVFRLRPPATVCRTSLCPWSETVLYRFAGALDGGEPSGAVAFDKAGNIYGATAQGGPPSGSCFLGSCGTVYKLTPSNGSWTESVLYSFAGGNDGQWPVGGVIFDGAGNLYGSTNGGGLYGGSYGYGTVFQLTPSGSGWVETILHAFQGKNDGQGQQDSPIIDKSGNLIGTTAGGGTGGGGTVYELMPSNGSWTFTTLYNLTGTAGPGGGVIMDPAGDLYSTTQLDGVNGQGSIFELTPSNNSWTYASLHDFTGGSDGKLPYCNLTMDSSGNLYGTTSEGGAYGYGVVFEMTKN